MILFHGITEIIEKPDVSFSKSYLDFGKRFYSSNRRMKNGWTLYVLVEKETIFIRTMMS